MRHGAAVFASHCYSTLKYIRIATRRSPLARWQAEWIGTKLRQHFADLDIQLLAIATTGDQATGNSLAESGGKGLFIKELEQLLLDDKADIAVHSMKDVPVSLPAGLAIAAIAERADVRDMLVVPRGSETEFRSGMRIGSVSLRRRRLIDHCCPGLQWVAVRGNLGTRLKKLANGDCDALILAAAGLSRLGQQVAVDFNCRALSPQQCMPAAGQGAIGVELRTDRGQLASELQFLNHEVSARCVAAERRVCQLLNTDCGSAIGVWAGQRGAEMHLQAAVAGVCGERLLQSCSGPGSDWQNLASRLAEALLGGGAAQLLGDGST